MALLIRAGSFDLKSPVLILSAALLGALALLTARRAPLRFTLTAAGFFLVGYGLFWNDGIIDRGRSFFGVYVVRDDAATGMRALGHGTTQHGLQFIEDAGTRPRILSYYHPNGPLGQIFLSGEVKSDARVGIVGLGVGALSCYAQPGQHWRFYEIDGLIDEIARNTALFSYMEQCAGNAPTILGDARLTLAHDEVEKFDLLLIDAYSSDAIPVHLITREALELYFSRLSPGGLLVFHISSRYYELGPVLGAAVRALGVSALEQLHEETPDRPLAPGEGAAHVALMARLPETLRRFADDRRWNALEPGAGAVWTDDHANVLSALKPIR
jgi:spermidine synthase